MQEGDWKNSLCECKEVVTKHDKAYNLLKGNCIVIPGTSNRSILYKKEYLFNLRLH